MYLVLQTCKGFRCYILGILAHKDLHWYVLGITEDYKYSDFLLIIERVVTFYALLKIKSIGMSFVLKKIKSIGMFQVLQKSKSIGIY